MRTSFLYFIVLFSLSIHIVFSTSFQYSNSTKNYQNDQTFTIQFVRSISTSNDILKDKSFGEELFDWIFGSDVLTLVKPVGIIKNNDEMIVLDQGRRELVKIDITEEDFYAIDFEDDENFPSLLDICKLSENDYLFTDSKNNTIYLFNNEDEEIKVFNTNLAFNQPTGIAINPKSKQIWVIDTKNHSIVVLDLSGNFIKRIGKRGTEPGEFNFPTYLSIDASGIAYVVDSMNFRLQMLNSEGKILNVFGEVGNATGYFARSKGVATDTYGHIYIVDALYNSIQIFNNEGQLLYYFGSTGSGPGEFWLPAGLYIDDNNFIYVADSYNSRIQIFKLVKND